ncbi:MAG: YkgJ family cysteine cluster protein [Candidatus Bathyarchaeia archaeon]
MSSKERQENFFDVCGECPIYCCKDARPPITLRRKKVIEEFLKEQKIQIDNPFVQTSYVFPKEDAEGYCIFFDRETRKCQIHPVKPETCVAGPITFDINLQSRKIEWFLKMESICPLAGKLCRDKKRLQRHLASAKREIIRLVKELDSTALRAILKIEEPETFKIDEDEIDDDVLCKLYSR